MRHFQHGMFSFSRPVILLFTVHTFLQSWDELPSNVSVVYSDVIFSFSLRQCIIVLMTFSANNIFYDMYIRRVQENVFFCKNINIKHWALLSWFNSDTYLYFQYESAFVFIPLFSCFSNIFIFICMKFCL